MRFFILLLFIGLIFVVRSVPTYVMLPLDLFDENQNLKDSDTLNSQLSQLSAAGVLRIE